MSSSAKDIELEHRRVLESLTPDQVLAVRRQITAQAICRFSAEATAARLEAIFTAEAAGLPWGLAEISNGPSDDDAVDH